MPTLSQHRMFVLTFLLGSLVAILARPLTIIFHGLLNPGFSFPAAISRPSKHIVAEMESHFSSKPKVAVIKEVTLLPLQTMYRSYSCDFSGKTLCKGQPCATTLRLSIDPDGAEEVAPLTIQSGSDGTYTFHVPFHALPNHQVDWKVTAISVDLSTREIHGRQILSDDSPIDVQQDIDIL